MVLTQYLISYSTMNYSIYFNGGKGANLRFENMGCWSKLNIFTNLMAIKPLGFILVELVVTIKSVLVVLAMLFDILSKKSFHLKVEDAMNDIIWYAFQMERSEVQIRSYRNNNIYNLRIYQR